ncbi:hypothetical protein ACJX0J_017323, partial [Zea mays]
IICCMHLALPSLILYVLYGNYHANETSQDDLFAGATFSSAGRNGPHHGPH